MPIQNYEDWEQSVLDQRVRKEKEKMVEDIANRKPPRGPSTVWERRLIEWFKVSLITLIAGLIVLFVIYQLPTYFEGLIDFFWKVYEFIRKLLSKS
ncbi:MAG: hypothetical protein H6751_17740 [Candidatus Omnitrophica bacterium]|nr:hypothetical protein [Candidatus Omnitrophota bacterium]MCA9443676.1 hypothetical protein [Candidatus Omnitrophota bacterium]MCB9784815.1 hypothetical protein [Candidatus Omnitrophota bacterium]